MTSLIKEPMLRFLVTGELPCPYLADRNERKLITELPFHQAQNIFERLSQAGFRRTHHMAYRPACRNCDQCIPVRIKASEFRYSRTQRKISNHNRDLILQWQNPVVTSEHYRLFSHYLSSRHHDSDMNDMGEADFVAMIEDTPIKTNLLECRTQEGRLLGSCLVDCSSDGLSAVYSFYDPVEIKRSLGTYLILSLVEAAQSRSLPYVYLGYFVPESQKMSYKSGYRPLEALKGNQWSLLIP